MPLGYHVKYMQKQAGYHVNLLPQIPTLQTKPHWKKKSIYQYIYYNPGFSFRHDRFCNCMFLLSVDLFLLGMLLKSAILTVYMDIMADNANAQFLIPFSLEVRCIRFYLLNYSPMSALLSIKFVNCIFLWVNKKANYEKKKVKWKFDLLIKLKISKFLWFHLKKRAMKILSVII